MPEDTGDRAELVARLCTHLEATEELPVDPKANHWLGEAQAVATDLRDGDPDASVVRERAGHVVRLLESAGDTDNETADEHVDAALALARRLAEQS